MPQRIGPSESGVVDSTLRAHAARRGSASRRCWSASILPSDGAKRGQACHPMRMTAALDRVPASSADDGADTPVPAQGVLVVNPGTPDAPTAAAVCRYLGEFLSDRRVVPAPRLLWVHRLHGVTRRATGLAREWEDVRVGKGGAS